MVSDDYEKYIRELDELSLSALKETFNIGASRAADSLSRMTGRPVSITVPEVMVVRIREVPEILGDDIKMGVYVRLSRGIEGHAFFLFEPEDGKRLFTIISGDMVETTREIDELYPSAMKEVGNILISSFANALSEFLGTVIEQTPPEFVMDFVSAILDFALADVGKYSDYTVILRTEIVIEDFEFRENFLLIPDPRSMERILKTLMEGLL
ncbi:chemotaxis protein CheC [Thermococcus sp.]